MAANDFSAIHVIIPALITAPQGLWAAVYDPKEATAEIGSLLKGGKFTQLALLRSRRDALRGKLLGPIYLVTHLVNIVGLIVIIAMVILGPPTLLNAADAGTLAEPLSDTERRIYWFALVVNVVVYIARGWSPMLKGWSVVIKASRRLGESES